MSGVSTNFSQVDDSVAEIFAAKINSYISLAVSLIGNVGVLCLAIVKRDRLRFSANLTTVIHILTAAIVFSVNYLLSCPMIHIHKDEVLIISNGILRNVLLGRLSLCIFAFFILYSAINSATALFLKYMSICWGHITYKKESHAIYSIQCLVAVLWTLTFAYSMWFRHEVMNDNHQHPLKGRPELYSEMGSKSLTLSLSILLILLVCAIVFMLFCSQRITVKLNRVQDARRKKLQKRMFRLLLVQTGLPFLLLHLPVLLSCTVPHTGGLPDFILDSFSLLYAWYPAFLPFVVLWNIRTKLGPIFITTIQPTKLETTVQLHL